MSRLPVVFLGPSLKRGDALDILEAEYLAPVQLGDVWRISQERPPAIGIVDGYFDRIPAVRHKEILHALAQRIPVYGSASMGALRGAELAAFGMVAVGAIATAFQSGELIDDDEVALLHADGEYGYLAFTEPLVNIRATATAAAARGVISKDTARRLIETAKALHYRDRYWDNILETTPAATPELAAFRAWLPGGRVDQKRADAVAMLERMRADLATPEPDRPASAHAFTDTVLWQETIRYETPIAAILEEFLLADPLPPPVKAAIAEAVQAAPVDWFAILQAQPEWRVCCERARRKRQCSAAPANPEDTDSLLAWFFGERLGWPRDLEAFLRDRAWTDPAIVVAVAAREANFQQVCNSPT